MKMHSTNTLSNPFARISLRGFSATLAVTILLIAPFTWSYLGAAGGMLIRAVDLLLLLAIIIMAARFRLARLPFLVPACLLGVACLYMLRGAIFGDGSAVISAMKIIYYLGGTLALATVFKEMSSKQNDRSTIYALFLASPILYVFLATAADVFIGFLQAQPAKPMSQVIFGTWNQIFSENLFGISGSLEVQGVAFRNSAGIAFLVVGLYYYLWDGTINRIVTITFMIIAAMLFSRSVWLLQLFFFVLVILHSNIVNRLFCLFLFIYIVITMAALPGLFEIFFDRINSDFGRFEMISVAIREFGSSTFFGTTKGALVTLSGGEEKNVHNVPLALALETGVFGFILSIIIAMVFLYTAVSRLFLLLTGRSEYPKATIVIILVSAILFMRPMVSASYAVYFSIGEWCALAIFLALVNGTGYRGRSRQGALSSAGAPTSVA